MVDKDKEVDLVLIAIRKIIRAIDLHSRKLVKLHGLSIPQIIVLKEIESNNSPTVGEIASSVSLSQATITNILTRLEHRGYVTRTQHIDDKRQVLVKTTDTGHEIIAKAPSLLHDRFVSSFQDLEDQEQHTIIASLQRVAEMMDADDIEASPVLVPGASLANNPHNLKSKNHY